MLPEPVSACWVLKFLDQLQVSESCELVPERLVEQWPETVMCAVLAEQGIARVHVRDIPTKTRNIQFNKSTYQAEMREEEEYLVISATGKSVKCF